MDEIACITIIIFNQLFIFLIIFLSHIHHNTKIVKGIISNNLLSKHVCKKKNKNMLCIHFQFALCKYIVVDEKS